MSPFRTNSTNYTVVDFLNAWARKEIRVNPKYQRSGEVWKETARSYLVETVLLDFPIPKLALHFVDTGDGHHKDIVDGQQRSAALRDYYNNKFPLSDVCERAELAGKYYRDLPSDFQRSFRTYRLNVDEFLDANDDQIREVFRRINSHTVPLNYAEQRHAIYQGRFKWFINSLRPTVGKDLVQIGVLNEYGVVRMKDARLIAEVVHAMLYGITGAKEADLTGMYKKYDEEFAQKATCTSQIRHALDVLMRWKWLHRTQLAKPLQVYALMLAIMHAQDGLPKLSSLRPRRKGGMVSDKLARHNLTQLIKALEADSPPKRFKSFVNASTTGTNGKQHREIRFKQLYDALTKSHPGETARDV